MKQSFRNSLNGSLLKVSRCRLTLSIRPAILFGLIFKRSGNLAFLKQVGDVRKKILRKEKHLLDLAKEMLIWNDFNFSFVLQY